VVNHVSKLLFSSFISVMAKGIIMYFSVIIRRFIQIYSRQLILKPNYLLNYPENEHPVARHMQAFTLMSKDGNTIYDAY
jgi:hypothetical protein